MTLSPSSASRRAVSRVVLVTLGLALAAVAPTLAAKASKRHRAEPRVERPAPSAEPETLPESTPAEILEPPSSPRSNLPAEIVITPHFSSDQRRARELEERERLRALTPQAEAWSRAFRAAGVPFARFVEETLRTLRTAIGRGSRNVCYPLAQATDRLAEALPEAPEAHLESQIRKALAQVANGARICLEGRPTTAQTEIGRGAEVLARAADRIVNWGR